MQQTIFLLLFIIQDKQQNKNVLISRYNLKKIHVMYRDTSSLWYHTTREKNNAKSERTKETKCLSPMSILCDRWRKCFYKTDNEYETFFLMEQQKFVLFLRGHNYLNYE